MRARASSLSFSVSLFSEDFDDCLRPDGWEDISSKLTPSLWTATSSQPSPMLFCRWAGLIGEDPSELLDWTLVRLRENEKVPAAISLLGGSELPTVIMLLENCDVCSESRLGAELFTVITLLENCEVCSESRLSGELLTVIMLLETCEVCSEGALKFPAATHGTTLFSLELGEGMRVLFLDFRYRSVSTSGTRPLYSSSDAMDACEAVKRTCATCVSRGKECFLLFLSLLVIVLRKN